MGFATPTAIGVAGEGDMGFTDKSVKALRAKSSRYEVWEGEGFGLRISPRGIKSWIWVYRYQRRPRRMTFGTYPAIGLADARIALANARKLLDLGKDPATEHVDQRRAERLAETVTELVEDYLDKWAQPRKRSAGEDERILRKDIIPRWGNRKAKDVTRKDVIALLDRIVERDAPIQANRTLACVRKVFAWGISRDLITINPCTAVLAPATENRRDRVLSAEEIRNLWDGFLHPDVEMEKLIRLALKFQLATGQRKGEIIAARWEEFDIEGDKLWTIPGERAKNGLPHRVPLSNLAVKLLKEIKAAERERAKRKDGSTKPESPLLFPSNRTDKPITGRAIDHAMRRNRKLFQLKDANPHDLRRTAASHMTAMGISRLVVSKILNHAESGITSVYDRHSYDKEKREALDAWGKRLDVVITTKGKVIPMDRARA
jgi:integrase